MTQSRTEPSSNQQPSGQQERPLLDAYAAALTSIRYPFTVPGHKRRAAALDAALGAIVDVDVPLFAGLDTMRLTGGRLETAESLAAHLWGADWCRFGVGGASQANQALLLALGRPGQQVVMSRSIHRSVMSGLVLSGLDPVWLPVRTDAGTALPVGPTPELLETTLGEHPDTAGVWITEPSYLGTVADVEGLAAVAHAHGVPLVVDQAWGAHLGFHPAYPRHALAAGADAMVVSAHKALPSYSQAALLLATTERLSAHRLEAAFDATHTTSPAGTILASIDGARQLLASRGQQLLGTLCGEVDDVRRRLRQECGGIAVPGPEDFGRWGFDNAKLVVCLAGTGADGIAVESDLGRRGITLEMADIDTVVATATIADTPDSLRALADALVDSIGERSGDPRLLRPNISFSVTPQRGCSPREAFFATSIPVSSEEAVGRTSAELVAVYPPGIPVLAPGEVVTSGLIADLQAQMLAGSRVAYADDPTLRTIRVLA